MPLFWLAYKNGKDVEGWSSSPRVIPSKLA